MSTTTVSVSPHRAHGPATTATFAGNLKSEWIKLTTVRSTIWSLIILTTVTLGLAALAAVTYGAATAMEGLSALFPNTRSLVVTVAFGSTSLTSLTVAVLGALFSAGEYGTGSIRSTLTASPRRLRVLSAKVVILGLTTFIFGLMLSVVSLWLAASLYSMFGHEFIGLADPEVVGAIVGAALYLALTAIFAVALGFVVRSVAAAISTVLGILFVLPMVVGLFGMFLKWFRDIAIYQFPNSGQLLYSIPGDGDALSQWQAALVVLAWIAVATGLAVLVLKRKDS